ncbi:MAG: SRPBCC family protein [Gammaproteobacteria bacterium]
MFWSRWMQWFRLISKAKFIFACIYLAFFQPSLAAAYEINRADVTEENGIFQIRVTAIFDAPAEYIREVLTDYTHIYRLSSSIIESEILPSRRTGDTQIRTKVLACASVFCREVERVDAVRTLASGDLQADIVPELSEFRSGQATWRITPMDDRSKLVYEATLEPDFYIPPVVGIPVIGNSLKKEFIATFERLERIASINARRDWTEDFTVARVDDAEARPPCEKNSTQAQNEP